MVELVIGAFKSCAGFGEGNVLGGEVAVADVNRDVVVSFAAVDRECHLPSLGIRAGGL